MDTHKRTSKNARWLAWAVILGLCAPFAASAQNRLQSVDFTQLKPGAAPGKPWQAARPVAGVEMVAAAPEGEGLGVGWLRLRDDSADSGVSLRQAFAPLAAGRLSFRVHLAADHASTFGLMLGIGSASSAADRVIALKTNDRGALRAGTSDEREATGITLEPGTTERIFVQWRPNAAGDNLDVVVGSVDDSGKVLQSRKLQVPIEPRPISTLRLATDKAATGAHFYLSDFRLFAL